MKCVTNSYTSLDEPSLLPAYAANPSSTRAAADQRGGYARGVIDWRQDVVYSFGDYGNDRLRP